ncbi:MAG TPA: DUF4388 domain-containing protein [Polyangia bacterium]
MGGDDRREESGDRPIDIDGLVGGLLGLDLPAATHIGGDGGAATAPLPFAIAGDLGDTEFLLLLGRAFTHVFTGRLHLTTSDGEATVWFSAGLPIDVATPRLLGSTRAASSAAAVEHAFFEVATWREGRFRFEPDADDGAHRVHALRHPAALAYEVLLRRDADPALAFWRGDVKNRFRLRWPVVTDVLSGLEPDLRVAVRLFDGGRTFAEVVKGSQIDEPRLLKAAFVLFCFDGLTPANDEATAASGSLDDRARTDRERIEALFKLAEESDYFTFLGVDREASRHEVLAAVERLRQELQQEQHPDIALATARQRAVIAEVIAEALRVLGDDDLRRRHRAALVINS